ncbi:MAG: efflux RND transporter periplasmic adaptor subunit, partial [Pseudomonadota bacterium]|nr:efflux RND transporter periplasmic adaptor subunit [Pseudomonadota bacterium]
STSRLRALQSQLDERVIKAPFAGYVGLRSISVGAMLQPGTLITTLDDTHIMKLDFSVPEVYLPALKKGNEIIAKAKAYPDEVFTGTISSIDSRVDSVTRSIAVRALINNEEGLLKPGMFLRVQLKSNPRNALTIPEESILSRADKSFVYQVQNPEAEQPTVSLQEVTLGIRKKGLAEITQGLATDDVIVTHGTLRLSEGSAVMIQAYDNGEPLIDLLRATAQNEK